MGSLVDRHPFPGAGLRCSNVDAPFVGAGNDMAVAGRIGPGKDDGQVGSLKRMADRVELTIVYDDDSAAGPGANRDIRQELEIAADRIHAVGWDRRNGSPLLSGITAAWICRNVGG